jgi:tetratricopeptide (TPR) repeat protein
MLQTDDDLPTLIAKQDHLNVLRFIRVHGLRESKLVVEHGMALLGGGTSAVNKKPTSCDELSRLAVLEQMCLAALDVGDNEYTQLAETCLDQLKAAGIAKESTRFRRLLARCLEAANDMAGAELIYNDLLKENPANCLAQQRLYCIYRAQVGKQVEAVTAMNQYLQYNPSDVGAWYELAKVQLEIGNVKAATFCYEEILLETPADAAIQCAVAECYATLAAQSTGNNNKSNLEYLKLARQHFSQAMELNPTSRRAQWGLLSAANNCLVYYSSTSSSSSNTKKDTNTTTEHEHDALVAEALLKFAAEKLLSSYKGTPMLPMVKKTIAEYTTNTST